MPDKAHAVLECIQAKGGLIYCDVATAFPGWVVLVALVCVIAAAIFALVTFLYLADTRADVQKLQKP